MNDPVRDYYDRGVEREWERLGMPLQRVEFEATLRLVHRYFPTTGKVCDIGAGPGRYALELARDGYSVSLVDISRELLDKAKRVFEDAGAEGAFVEGDARDLTGFPDASFDAALVLGPLYHLTESDDRSKVLTELGRILKPGGVAIAAYLNTWGLIRTGLSDFPTWYRSKATIRSLLIERGYSSDELSGFTTAYWSTPTVALQEIAASGLEVITYAGAEGFCGGMATIVSALAERDPEAYRNVVAVAAEECELPQYRDSTDHLLVVVRRPASTNRAAGAEARTRLNATIRKLAEPLVTDRLVLRVPTVEDAPVVNRAVVESLPQLQQWMDWAAHMPSVEETAAVLARAQSDYRTGVAFSFAAFLREDGAFIGMPALFNIDWAVPMLEIGYWIRSGYGGKGLMTEAVRALVDLGFETMAAHRIEIRTDPRNAASAAIPERLGFRLEGVLRNQKRDPQGELRDTSIYALTGDAAIP